ncbi:MAG TPA: pyridoxamine 5'-phosphate oxidase family protein [Actinoplanes sp.]|nr:pyridoxamine 5'-phosphate oxidase family protein [Actinoplanes sp.]
MSLDGVARDVIDTNRYLTLGTTGSDHRPRVSPVYYTHAGYRTFYWVSSPRSRHSANIAERPQVAIVIFDSTAAVGRAQAVYLDAIAAEAADEELSWRCAEAFAHVGPGAYAFRPDELRGDATLRLYHAHATTIEIHIPARDPEYGTGVDSRRPVVPY